MTLPIPQDIMTPPASSRLGTARLANPPVANHNAVFQAKCGHAAWNGNQFVVSGEGLVNYWFIPAVEGQVSYCVVHGNGNGDAYVISDQYGGCEYHQLYNAQFNLLAFLHVYRGNGYTADYTPAQGWVLQSVKRSSHIAQAGGMNGSNWSFTHIDRGTVPPTVQSKFIGVNGYPTIRVVREDDGDAPYQN